jgi:hypothetical protein
MPVSPFRASASPRPAGSGGTSDVVPDLFDTGTERLPSSGQFGAAMVSGLVLLGAELLVAPLVFGITAVASLFFWWLLDQPWSGRRKRTRRRGITSRLLYLSTLMIVGMWLSVMFVFRASDPSLSAGFTSTLPTAMFGIDISMLSTLNGMKTFHASNTPVAMPQSSFAPFSLFAHGTASAIAMSLLAYVVVSARRDARRKMRKAAVVGSTASSSRRTSR